ncbi:GCR1-dependent translation factor 1 [Cladobotryum mycophilum]|uniref:GCR1-dependent translation factor 1 n=1 Tax=Cladobotryum mycophilum TaxID=491253 RepID=A0ABR0T3A0_9HYPO
MRFRTKHSPLLLLLLPSLTSALTPQPAAAPPTKDEKAAIAAADGIGDSSTPSSLKGRLGVPTKDAPVDGKDGKPHLGPFVESGGVAAADSDRKDLPPLKGRPKDLSIVDGEKIPESNDGIMFDKNRQRPQEGTTGTEGGVSEKDKARKAHEGKTGEKLVTQPEAPKEQPPLPHSEEQKIQGKDKSKDSDSTKDKPKSADKEKGGTDYTGLEKPDLPDMPREKPPPVPNSAQKDHLDISKPSTGGSKDIPASKGEEEGIIQPFHSFILSFTMIMVSEIGDKTFLVAALMAMKHDRMVVFSAAFGALFVMTVLSAVLGHAVPALIPKRLTGLLAAGLFLVFGAKLLREGMQMDPNEGVAAEMHEVEQELAEKEKELERRGGSSVSPHALEMGLNGRGSRSQGRFPSSTRSPSESPSRHPSRKHGGGANGFLQGVNNLCSLVLSPAWVQTFVMTFLGEWGDRSQIATIAMAAGQDYWWVTLGALAGHSICTGIAVIGGRAIAGRVSLKVVTVGGAVAFLVFAFIYFIEALYA